MLTACEKTHPDAISLEGFSIHIGEDIVFSHESIDYYDYSSHLIYLEDGVELPENLKGGFRIYADGHEIYRGNTRGDVPLYSSYFPVEPIIESDFYPNYVIPISNPLLRGQSDPKEDIRIVDALKHYNEFHPGLICGITSIERNISGRVELTLNLRNEDSFDYYYLDPEKMGLGLFGYFTTALNIYDIEREDWISYELPVVKPDSIDEWKREWLSLIRSREQKEIVLNYEGFEKIDPGRYLVHFKFPGLTKQVDRDELIQEEGKIWLGRTNVQKEWVIE